MRPYGQKRVGFGGDEKWCRAGELRRAERAERVAQTGEDIDEDELRATYCKECGGPCTGLGDFQQRLEAPAEPSQATAKRR